MEPEPAAAWMFSKLSVPPKAQMTSTPPEGGRFANPALSTHRPNRESRKTETLVLQRYTDRPNESAPGCRLPSHRPTSTKSDERVLHVRCQQAQYHELGRRRVVVPRRAVTARVVSQGTSWARRMEQRDGPP